jgi:hypothetical protein
VAGGYRWREDGLLGFSVGPYDASRPLVIDPVLVYSTSLGGISYDAATGVAVDVAGNAFVGGYTESPDFPLTVGAYDQTPNGQQDAFLVKVAADGRSLAYATLLGGAGPDSVGGVAVDGAGQAYLTGQTWSADFPLTPDASFPRLGGASDSFLTKLNPSGSGLVSSTYLAGRAPEVGTGVAADGAGNVYVVGHTASADFPQTVAALPPPRGGGGNAFVVKIGPGTGGGAPLVSPTPSPAPPAAPPGSVWTWGDNRSGELGDGTTALERLTPVQVQQLADVVAIAAGTGWGHGLALRRDGTVWAWGSNREGEYGDGTRYDYPVPLQTVSSLRGSRPSRPGRTTAWP